MQRPAGQARKQPRPLSNTEIARALFQLADAVEAVGGPDAGYRARALRTGAQAVDGLAEPAADLLVSGTLTRMRGIGEGIARRVEELVNTGGLSELDELSQHAAPGLFEMLRVEGMGPKTARLVNRELGIRTLDELEQAARDGLLRDLRGLGPLREERILQAIERARRDSGRFSLNRAELEAANIVERLRGVRGVDRVEAAGSLRRRRETVGDVDILVATEDPRAVIDAFVRLASVETVTAAGETKASVKLRSGLQVDLRVVPRESWGAALHYFTGSKEHNVAIRGLAVRRGLKINEYGVFRVGELHGAARAEADGERVGGAEEAEVFAAVGLPWIPPELREYRGEIEAAAEGRLPRLVELGDVRGDLHVHTDATDGRASVERMARAVEQQGRGYLAITDHSESLKFVHGMDAARLRAQREEIGALNRRLEREGRTLRVLCGIEADILPDGAVDLEPDLLRELDWAIASVHSQFNLSREQQTERVIRAMESGLIDALGHPTGRLLGRRLPYELEIERVIEVAARTGVALECNAQPDRLDLCDLHCRLAREAGALVVIDSDSHSTSQPAAMRWGVDTARRGWLEAKHVLNTRPLEELLDYVRERRGRGMPRAAEKASPTTTCRGPS